MNDIENEKETKKRTFTVDPRPVKPSFLGPSYRSIGSIFFDTVFRLDFCGSETHLFQIGFYKVVWLVKQPGKRGFCNPFTCILCEIM